MRRWLILLSAALSFAANAGPTMYRPEYWSLPDQPGALSAGEIKVASQAMGSRFDSKPAPVLVASGKLADGNQRYAVFATPFESVSDRIKARQRFVCFDLVCAGPQTEVQVDVHGASQTFPFPHPQAAGEIVDFLYSPCLGAGQPILSVVALRRGTVEIVRESSDWYGEIGKFEFDVNTGPVSGGGDFYVLERKGVLEEGCKFSVLRTGKVMTQRQARDSVRSAEWTREIAAAGAAFRKEWGGAIFGFGALCAALALVVSAIVMRTGRWPASAAAMAIGAVSLLAMGYFGQWQREDWIYYQPVLAALVIWWGVAAVGLVKAAWRRRG
jgi:hypothetical protein